MPSKNAIGRTVTGSASRSRESDANRRNAPPHAPTAREPDDFACYPSLSSEIYGKTATVPSHAGIFMHACRKDTNREEEPIIFVLSNPASAFALLRDMALAFHCQTKG